MKKILWIAPQSPSKTTGFGVVFYYRVKALIDLGFEVKVVNFLAPFDREKNQVGIPRPAYWNIPMIIRSIVRDNPLVMERHYSKEFVKHLLTFKSWKPDVVIAAPDFMAPYLTFFENRKIIEIHDIRFLVYNRYMQLAKTMQKPFLMWETRRTKRFEVSCANLSDEQWLIGKDDFLLSTTCRFHNPFYIPVGIETENYPFLPQGDKILFLGSYSWFPNRDALDYFLNEIWPGIIKMLPSQELLIIGRMFPTDIYNIKSIKILGEIKDMSEIWQQTGILVVPVRIGSGIRVKILEAMAMGKAVITTKEGAEGLEYDHGSIVVVRSKYDFIRKLTWLIENPEVRKIIGTAARKSIEKYYSLEKIKMILKMRLLCK
jgi:glycosyltransferase involved in cell wall biosynthesis